jgi:hypothetical protein
VRSHAAAAAAAGLDFAGLRLFSRVGPLQLRILALASTYLPPQPTRGTKRGHTYLPPLRR